ncbi:hypothetical protein J437_LFUL019448 [Ladona fulva]|uniref:SOSS complex subunit A homolog n=1 Tax=Ladona fulva TaxID=123851 RepID=A0A8K0PCN3_LADFU|nr:hypothetical protein J437_LFUL019448 [Ladona fulva]
MKYLATPESQSLRCDLIRFIVGVIHPTNELLCSDIIPRWAVIGWLLTNCTSPVAASNAKLALFYDWLFYDPEKDNIMNIEVDMPPTSLNQVKMEDVQTARNSPPPIYADCHPNHSNLNNISPEVEPAFSEDDDDDDDIPLGEFSGDSFVQL